MPKHISFRSVSLRLFIGLFVFVASVYARVAPVGRTGRVIAATKTDEHGKTVEDYTLEEIRRKDLAHFGNYTGSCEKSSSDLGSACPDIPKPVNRKIKRPPGVALFLSLHPLQGHVSSFKSEGPRGRMPFASFSCWSRVRGAYGLWLMAISIKF